MQEGSLRCDVNLSVRKKGAAEFGTRTEMKNLNSFQFIGKAIAYEFRRQVEALEAGESIVQETRRFDEKTGKTYSMRSKEDADDYRYFPDPDLVPIELSEEYVEQVKKTIPRLPDERKAAYMEQYGLKAADAENLVSEREIADAFEAAAKQTKDARTLAHLILSEGFRLLGAGETQIPIAPEHLAKLADLLAEGRINNATGKKLFAQLWERDGDPAALAEEQNLWQISDESVLRLLAESVLARNPKTVESYRSGKVQAMQALIGQTMGAAGGQGNPAVIRRIVEELLKQ